MTVNVAFRSKSLLHSMQPQVCSRLPRPIVLWAHSHPVSARQTSSQGGVPALLALIACCTARKFAMLFPGQDWQPLPVPFFPTEHFEQDHALNSVVWPHGTAVPAKRPWQSSVRLAGNSLDGHAELWYKLPCLNWFHQVDMVPALCAVAKRSFWANFGVCTSMVIREAIDRVKTRWDFDTSNRIVTVLSVGTCFTYIALHCILIPTRRADRALGHAQVWGMFSWQTGQACGICCVSRKVHSRTATRAISAKFVLSHSAFNTE